MGCLYLIRFVLIGLCFWSVCGGCGNACSPSSIPYGVGWLGAFVGYVEKKLHCKMHGGYLVLIVQASILAELGRWGSFYAFPIPPEIIYEGHNHPVFLIYRNIFSVQHLHNFSFHVVG